MGKQPHSKRLISDGDVTGLAASIIAPSLPHPSLSSSDPPISQSRIPKTATTRAKSATSPYLRYFVPCSDPLKLRCIICKPTPPTLVRYIYGRRKTTSSLKEHMALHPIEQSVILGSDSRYEQARRHLLRAVATGALSFTVANNQEIREFVHCLDPGFVMPDRTTLSTTVLDSEYDSAYSTVRNAVAYQDVCISFDHWTSKDSNHSLMGATCHMIDSDWKRQLYIISLDPVNGAHNGAQVRNFYHSE